MGSWLDDKGKTPPAGPAGAGPTVFPQAMVLMRLWAELSDEQRRAVLIILMAMARRG